MSAHPAGAATAAVLEVRCNGTARRGCGYVSTWLGGARQAVFERCPQCKRLRRSLTVTVQWPGEPARKEPA